MGTQLVATIDTTSPTSNTPTFITTDHLGSTEKGTNTLGTVSLIRDYYPYGNPRVSIGTTPKSYIGEVYDVDSSLSYLHARYYDSSRGQFVSQDPVFWKFDKDKDLYKKLLTDPQQWNSYSYSRGNPITNKDPNGESLVNALFFGRYASEQDQQELGMAVDYQYNNSATWKTALDNPVATGAIVAVGAGVLAYAG